MNKILTVVAIFLITLFVSHLAVDMFKQKIINEVIHELQRDYAPGPYTPGFDPDKVNPKRLPPPELPKDPTNWSPQNWNQAWEQQRQ